MKFDVKKEVRKWNDRVIYDVRFREDTEANLKRLDEFMMISMEHFVTIAAISEPLCYKICRYYIESGKVKNDEIYIIDGEVIKSYMGDDAVEWRKKERIDDFFQIFAGDLKGKWIMIPLLDFDMSVGIAIYFISRFKKYGACGLIMYAEGSNNLVEVMIKSVEDRYFFEYPKPRYKRTRNKKLLDDKW